MIKSGDNAVDFTLSNHKGETINLSSFKGSPVWLSFYRYASCPLCNLRIGEIIKSYDRLTQAGLKIVCIFQSPPESVAKYVGKQMPPFNLLCDPKEMTYKLYGLESRLSALASTGNVGKFAKALSQGFLPGKIEGSVGRVPGDFLIAPDFSVVDSFYGKDIGDHIPFSRVEDYINSL